MSSKFPTVVHKEVVKVGDLEIKVLTLDNGQRIILKDDLKKAIIFIIGITEKDFELLKIKKGGAQ